MRIVTSNTYFFIHLFVYYLHVVICLFIPLSLPQFVFRWYRILFPICIHLFTTSRIAFIHNLMNQISYHTHLHFYIFFNKLYCAFDDKYLWENYCLYICYSSKSLDSTHTYFIA